MRFQPDDSEPNIWSDDGFEMHLLACLNQSSSKYHQPKTDPGKCSSIKSLENVWRVRTKQRMPMENFLPILWSASPKSFIHRNHIFLSKSSCFKRTQCPMQCPDTKQPNRIYPEWIGTFQFTKKQQCQGCATLQLDRQMLCAAPQPGNLAVAAYSMANLANFSSLRPFANLVDEYEESEGRFCERALKDSTSAYRRKSRYHLHTWRTYEAMSGFHSEFFTILSTD